MWCTVPNRLEIRVFCSTVSSITTIVKYHIRANLCYFVNNCYTRDFLENVQNFDSLAAISLHGFVQLTNFFIRIGSLHVLKLFIGLFERLFPPVQSAIHIVNVLPDVFS